MDAFLPKQCACWFAQLRSMQLAASSAQLKNRQKWAQQNLDAIRFGSSLAPFFSCRIRKHFLDIEDLEVLVADVLARLRRRRLPRLSSAWAKSVTLGWNATARLHTTLVPCVFCGFEDADDQRHMLRCKSLYDVLRLNTGFPYGHSSATLRRLLLPSDDYTFFVLMAAHSAYHKIRLGGAAPGAAFAAAWRLDGPPASILPPPAAPSSSTSISSYSSSSSSSSS